jgi:hypothetical protein
MKTAMSWRPVLLGAALSAMSGAPMHEGPMQVLWAIPAARADDTLNTLPAGASGGTTASASAHASASVTTSASGQGCVAESTADAKAQAGDEQKSSSDHKRVVGVNGPCQASASSRANAVAGPPVDPSTKE